MKRDIKSHQAIVSRVCVLHARKRILSIVWWYLNDWLVYIIVIIHNCLETFCIVENTCRSLHYQYVWNDLWRHFKNKKPTGKLSSSCQNVNWKGEGKKVTWIIYPGLARFARSHIPFSFYNGISRINNYFCVGFLLKFSISNAIWQSPSVVLKMFFFQPRSSTF